MESYQIKRGNHGEPRSEYTAAISSKNEQLGFVQRWGEEWAAFLDKLSPASYVWFLGHRRRREDAEKIMLKAVNEALAKTEALPKCSGPV